MGSAWPGGTLASEAATNPGGRSPRWELFDTEADPTECHDLAARLTVPTHPNQATTVDGGLSPAAASSWGLRASISG